MVAGNVPVADAGARAKVVGFKADVALVSMASRHLRSVSTGAAAPRRDLWVAGIRVRRRRGHGHGRLAGGVSGWIRFVAVAVFLSSLASSSVCV